MKRLRLILIILTHCLMTVVLPYPQSFTNEDIEDAVNSRNIQREVSQSKTQNKDKRADINTEEMNAYFANFKKKFAAKYPGIFNKKDGKNRRKRSYYPDTFSNSWTDPSVDRPSIYYKLFPHIKRKAQQEVTTAVAPTAVPSAPSPMTPTNRESVELKLSTKTPLSEPERAELRALRKYYPLTFRHLFKKPKSEGINWLSNRKDTTIALTSSEENFLRTVDKSSAKQATATPEYKTIPSSTPEPTSHGFTSSEESILSSSEKDLAAQYKTTATPEYKTIPSGTTEPSSNVFTSSEESILSSSEKDLAAQYKTTATPEYKTTPSSMPELPSDFYFTSFADLLSTSDEPSTSQYETTPTPEYTAAPTGSPKLCSEFYSSSSEDMLSMSYEQSISQHETTPTPEYTTAPTGSPGLSSEFYPSSSEDVLSISYDPSTSQYETTPTPEYKTSPTANTPSITTETPIQPTARVLTMWEYIKLNPSILDNIPHEENLSSSETKISYIDKYKRRKTIGVPTVYKYYKLWVDHAEEELAAIAATTTTTNKPLRSSSLTNDYSLTSIENSVLSDYETHPMNDLSTPPSYESELTTTTIPPSSPEIGFFSDIHKFFYGSTTPVPTNNNLNTPRASRFIYEDDYPFSKVATDTTDILRSFEPFF